MSGIKATAAEEIANAAIAFQRECTGVVPESVSVLLGERTLVVTLHEARSPAETALARTPAGAAHVREFHRLLFQNSAGTLYQDLGRILKMEVGEASVEIEPAKGHFVEVFPSGAIVQIFHLSRAVETQSWSTPNAEAVPPAI
jgi:uncharacterized protein YbcI